MILVTGASGMLGSYIKDEFRDDKVISLGRGEDNDIRCDLTDSVPDIGSRKFETVIHCAGTEHDKGAEELNFRGTERLIKSLENNLPTNFVFVSSYQVYSEDAGENVDESENLWASTDAGRYKALAENLLKEWAENKGITLTILRPAKMFGEGVKGEMLELFNDALSGKFIHIRGNDARVSVVTALDVAKAAKVLYRDGGIYNVSDNFNPRLIDLVEAMTANAGSKKRMTHLPIKWAEWIWRLGRWIPAVDRNLHPEVVEKRMKSFTINGSKLTRATGMTYFNTLEVIERVSESYPYKNLL